MDKREGALRGVLDGNAVETERWKNYQKEQETAIENLDNFGKQLTVDVMVPIGSKALMPGQLIHTNEVLVGHYQGYFSKCSAHKAKEICQHRINMSQELLSQLKIEADLFQNNLEKPYKEGIWPTDTEREIIEDYVEDVEKKWNEEHKLSKRRAKLDERKERENLIKKSVVVGAVIETHENVIEMLEEKEMLEELQTELENLELHTVTDSTVRALISGELTIKSKPRVPHSAKKKTELQNVETKTDSISKTIELPKTNENLKAKLELQNVETKTDSISKAIELSKTNENLKPKPELQNVEKKTDFISNVIELPKTNENLNTKPEINSNVNKIVLDHTNTDNPDIQLIKDHAESLATVEQIEYYQWQIQNMRQKLKTLSSKVNINEKNHLLIVLAELSDLLDDAEDKHMMADSDDISEEQDDIIDEKIELANRTAHQLQKRRISFAPEDDTLEFCKNEAVSQMLPKPDTDIITKQDKCKRDIITLDDPIVGVAHAATAQSSSNPINKKQSILEKVERNLSYAAEKPTVHNYDLVNTILTGSTGEGRTLNITFKHSAQPGYVASTFCGEIDEENVPASPADCYQIYLRALENQNAANSGAIFFDAYPNEEDVKVPILRESSRDQAYEDPRANFSIPGIFVDDDEANTSTPNSDDKKVKSILRNKSLVEKENHLLAHVEDERAKKHKSNKKKNRKSKTHQQVEYRSAYNIAVSNVVEHIDPDPVPQGRYIDSRCPKKRISLFKQLRAISSHNK